MNSLGYLIGFVFVIAGVWLAIWGIMWMIDVRRELRKNTQLLKDIKEIYVANLPDRIERVSDESTTVRVSRNSKYKLLSKYVDCPQCGYSVNATPCPNCGNDLSNLL